MWEQTIYVFWRSEKPRVLFTERSNKNFLAQRRVITKNPRWIVVLDEPDALVAFAPGRKEIWVYKKIE